MPKPRGKPKSEGRSNRIKVYIVKTQDDHEIEVDFRLVKLSETLREAFKSNKSKDPVPIDLTKEVFEKIIRYCVHYDYNLPTAEGLVTTVYPHKMMKIDERLRINDWDREFLGEDGGPKGFMDILLAAHYLKMEYTLFRVCIKFFANLMRGRNCVQLACLFKDAMREYGFAEEVLQHKTVPATYDDCLAAQLFENAKKLDVERDQDIRKSLIDEQENDMVSSLNKLNLSTVEEEKAEDVDADSKTRDVGR